MPLILVTAHPVEGGPLSVRLEGPFAAPAPRVYLQVEGHQVVANIYFEDYVLPQLPPVAAVVATIPAPVAGDYVLVERHCGGNPPPPSPSCTTTGQQGFAIASAFAVPVDAGLALLLLAGGVAALAAQRMERALTALERLRS